MAQQPPVPSLIESSMPWEIKSCVLVVLGNGKNFEKIALMTAKLWDEVMGSYECVQNEEKTK